MYARLRAASTSPSVCSICVHSSRFRTTYVTGKRWYAAQAALVTRPVTQNVEAGPSHQDSVQTTHVSRTKRSSSGKGQPKPSATAKTEQKDQRDTQRDAKVTRKALREAQEAERRRKALAILDKTTKFVAAVKETPREPTLEDLERLRPKQPPFVTLKFVYPEPSSRLHRRAPSDSMVERYSTAFQELVDTLSQRFRKKQLLQLLREGRRQRTGAALVGTPRHIGSLTSSYHVAEEIVRWLWHWPYVSEVKAQKAYLTVRSTRDSPTVGSPVFPISTSEFFLLLIPDGSSLLTLTESYGVVIKKVERTADAFALVVDGPSYMLDQLAAVLSERKKAMISELVHVDSLDPHPEPSPNQKGSFIRPDLVQRISKLSQALVEDKGGGMLRISAHQVRNIETAKRLAVRASHQATLPPPLLVHLPTLTDPRLGVVFPHAYALFPFELSNRDTLPWQWTHTGMLSNSSHPVPKARKEEAATPTSSDGAPYLFRVRKVSEWLEQPPTHAMQMGEGLRDSVGRVLSSTGQQLTLRDALGLPNLSDLESCRNAPHCKITATTGHIVFAASLGLRGSLSPPLRGSWILPEFLDWMKADAGRATFIPRPPHILVNALSSHRIALSRLIYRASPSIHAAPVSSQEAVNTPCAEPLKTLKFEVLPSHLAHTGQDLKLATGSESPKGGDTVSRPLHDYLGAASSSQSRADTTPLCTFGEALASVFPNSTTAVVNTPLPENPTRFWSGIETFVNLMLPDRPMDIQLSSLDLIPMPQEYEPPELQTYALNLRHWLGFPDASSRPYPPLHVTYEGTHYVLDSNATVRWSSQRVTGDPKEPVPPVTVITENNVDVESNHKAFVCQITSPTNKALAWRKFLVECDQMTWLRMNGE